MEVRIEKLVQKTLIGKSIRMSLVDNKTPEVWRNFMTKKGAITNSIGTDLYSIQVYDNLHYFEDFSPKTEFTKWAAIEVSNHSTVPTGYDAFVIPEGLYAVFNHKGDISVFQKTIQYIFSQWLPKSEYQLDQRPHFELLSEKYKNGSSDSEEEIWIPIGKKQQ